MNDKEKQIIEYKKNNPFCMHEDIKTIFNYKGNINKLFKDNSCTTMDLTGLRYRKYDVNDSYFEKIDTPEKAYILGVLYTDGYLIIEGEKTKRIGLDVEDIEWLENIKNILSPNSPLYNTAKPHIKRMKITSPKMYEDLIRLGCTPNKTFTIGFPTPDQVPNELLSPFILGLWDGDGSIEIHNRKVRKWEYTTYKISFTKTKELVQGIQKFLGVEHLKLGQRYPERNNNNFTLSISGTNCVKKALEKIYSIPINICLKRKYENYIKIINDSRAVS